MLFGKMNKIRAGKCRKYQIVQGVAGDMQNIAGTPKSVDDRLAAVV